MFASRTSYAHHSVLRSIRCANTHTTPVPHQHTSAARPRGPRPGHRGHQDQGWPWEDGGDALLKSDPFPGKKGAEAGPWLPAAGEKMGGWSMGTDGLMPHLRVPTSPLVSTGDRWQRPFLTIWGRNSHFQAIPSCLLSLTLRSQMKVQWVHRGAVLENKPETVVLTQRANN